MNQPTARPMDPDPEAEAGKSTNRSISKEISSIPWVDPHQHTQTLSWNDQQKFALSGCQAAVTIAYNPFWTPYRPVEASDVRFLWDLAIKWAPFLDSNHSFTTSVALGIHTLSKVKDCEKLTETLREYSDLDKVVAIGETGIEPVQYGSRWPVEQQKDIVREQMRIANQVDLPIILHTPSKKSTDKSSSVSAKGWGGVNITKPDPSFDYDDPKIEATKIDVELLDETNLSEEQVVFDHGSPSNIEYVMENTDCYLAFSVSTPLKGVTTEDIAETIQKYGPDRIMINSDMIGYRECDLFCVPRTIQSLHRMGVELEDLKTVVYDNPMDVFDLE